MPDKERLLQQCQSGLVVIGGKLFYLSNSFKSRNVNEAVTQFLKALQHPMEEEIFILRQTILAANQQLSENIKWNGPNYSLHGEDRITMRINPPKQVQVIFHRGAKVLDPPAEKLIQDKTGLLAWKTNDRAVATFKDRKAIEKVQVDLFKIINDWLAAAK